MNRRNVRSAAQGRTSPTRRSLLLGMAATPALSLIGCSREQSSEVASTPAVAPPAVAPMRVGSSSIPASLELTPQTVIVKDAARAFKGIEPDRRTLRFDATAASDLKPGSVALLTDVAVVKVQSVATAGGDVLITAQPCAITELIAAGVIEFSGVRIDPRAGRMRVADSRRATAPLMALLDMLFPPAHAGEDRRYRGTIADYEVEAVYRPEGDQLLFDGSIKGDFNGVTVDVDLNGHLSGFELGGRIAVANGSADNLNMLLKNISGEIGVDARGGRGAKGEHKGEEMLRLPLDFEWPLVIDGIPFLLKLSAALLINEGFTSVDATAAVGANLKFNGSTGFDMRLPGEPDQAQQKAEGEMNYDFSISRSDGVGLGPQALMVACQFPRLGFGLGLGEAYAGTFIDVVTAASTTTAGATAPVPCQRGQLVVTGSAGVEAEFLLWEQSRKVEVYRKEVVRTVPDVKACSLGA